MGRSSTSKINRQYTGGWGIKNHLEKKAYPPIVPYSLGGSKLAAVVIGQLLHKFTAGS